MIVFIFLVLCAALTSGINEGDSCSKKGVAGVCANIRLCPDAQQDIKNKQIPQLCDFTGVDPIVCCVSLKVVEDRPQTDKCVFPPHPSNGYFISNIPKGKPGDVYEILAVYITCNQGYEVDGPRSNVCKNGAWSEKMPKCVPICRLMSHPSIEYSCVVTEGGVNGSRSCRQQEPEGTVVSPLCRHPYYYSPTTLEPMRCVDGAWSYDAKCVPVCGTVTGSGRPLVPSRDSLKLGELPWHAAIYTKLTNPYSYLCGGSLISMNTIISAAICFWADKCLQPAHNYAVAVGKLYQKWDDPRDEGLSQQADVEKIHLPMRFQGVDANLHNNIAVVVTTLAFKLNAYTRPVCLDFDYDIESRQLQSGNKGRVASFKGFTEVNKTDVRILKAIELPYVDLDTCFKEYPSDFNHFLTSDKICAGEKHYTGKLLCGSDGGSGLVSLSSVEGEGIPRHYLRAVYSPSTSNDSLCSTNLHFIFTRVQAHERFLMEFFGPEQS